MSRETPHGHHANLHPFLSPRSSRSAGLDRGAAGMVAGAHDVGRDGLSEPSPAAAVRRRLGLGRRKPRRSPVMSAGGRSRAPGSRSSGLPRMGQSTTCCMPTRPPRRSSCSSSARAPAAGPWWPGSASTSAPPPGWPAPRLRCGAAASGSTSRSPWPERPMVTTSRCSSVGRRRRRPARWSPRLWRLPPQPGPWPSGAVPKLGGSPQPGRWRQLPHGPGRLSGPQGYRADGGGTRSARRVGEGRAARVLPGYPPG